MCYVAVWSFYEVLRVYYKFVMRFNRVTMVSVTVCYTFPKMRIHFDFENVYRALSLVLQGLRPCYELNFQILCNTFFWGF